MCAGGIDWCAFDWEAFSTLATGLLAVGAAFWVGCRQTGIQTRQTALQEMTLRSDLFDRRYKVFERTEQFLLEIDREASDPSKETRRDYVIAMGEAKFLFSQKVCEGLDEIWNKWADLRGMQGKNYDAEDEAILLKWFHDRLQTLPKIFDELRLGGDLVPH